MRLRYAGTCRLCAKPVPAREWALYFADARQIECLDCGQDCAVAPIEASSVADPDPVVDPEPAEGPVDADDPPAPSDVDTSVESGVAGASARREHQRRVAKNEERVRAAHPKIGGLILRLQDEPQSTRAWARGAAGEEKLAQRLDGLAEQGVRLLHDRRIPRSRANIDHIAVGPAGVFVIDAKRYQGRPHMRIDGGILRPRTEVLLVGRRDCTALVAAVTKQVDLVRAALTKSGHHDVQLRGMLCFVDADWPLFGGDFDIGGVSVLWPKKAAERLLDSTALTPDQIQAIHRALATAFPPA